jgi:hypothetical protein
MKRNLMSWSYLRSPHGRFYEGKKEEDGPIFDEKQQAKVNALLAEERRHAEERFRKAEAELKALAEKAGLSDKEKEEMARRLNDREKVLTSELETTKRAANEARLKYESEIKARDEEVNAWRNRHKSTLVKQALVSAATHKDIDAHNAEQIVGLFAGSTVVTDVNDADGKPTGNYDIKLRVPSKDSKGKAIELVLDPIEALKELKKDDSYGNLFKSSRNSGAGHNPGQGGPASNLATTDFKAYEQQRSGMK